MEGVKKVQNGKGFWYFDMATQGYKMDNTKNKINDADTLHTTRNGILAFGVYGGENFEVLEGSEIDMSRKCYSATMEKQRQIALENGDIVCVDGKHRLTVSVSFTSPSSAAMFVLGGSTNGWAEWKGKDGKTLDEIQRKQSQYFVNFYNFHYIFLIYKKIFENLH